jgi:glycosyltransferase involved in cell wall biosynthesis
VTAIPTVVTEAHAPAPSRTKLHALGLKAPRPVEITDARRITAWRLPAAVSPAAVPFPRSQEHAFALCLAPVAPGSGCHVVLKAAKRAGVPVRLAGRVAPDRRSLRYHLKQILPRLDCDRRFVGSVDAALRRTLMEQALCLVLPPSGGDFNLLIAEALAAGAPVISFDPHAADGLIEPGVTGYFVRNENELVKALQKAAQLNRMACLRRAAELRSLEGMLQECLKLYLGLLPPAIFAAAS